MDRLLLEYVLEGQYRGYNFTSPTHHLDDDVLKMIWRHAMPRGQGWGRTIYTGARSIKMFPLPDGRIAISEVTVTDMTDENGRRGIRRAIIDIMTKHLLGHHLSSRLAGYPTDVHHLAQQKYDKIVPSLHPKKDQPLLLTYPYTGNHQHWWPIEALILMLVAHPPPLLRRLRRRQTMTFTTLALDYRKESMFIGIPEDVSHDIRIPAINVS